MKLSTLRATLFLLSCCSWTVPLVAADSAPPVRNVVLMIADGAGYNTWKATAMYEGTLGRDFHDAPGWIRLAVSTHALRQHAGPPVSAEHGGTQLPALVYDPLRAWDPTPVAGERHGYPYHFAGYRWLWDTAPDSANTVSALVTGRKTYAGGINFDGRGQPLEDTLARLAHVHGKRVGVVTDVPFSHATPAGGAGAHHPDRKAHCELAVEMLTGPYPDVIAGCGNPDFDNNGEPIEDDSLKYHAFVGGREVWDVLTGARPSEPGLEVCVRPVAGGLQGVALTAEQSAALGSWELRQSRSEIEALRRGAVPERLLLVPRVGQLAFWKGLPSSPSGPRVSRAVGGPAPDAGPTGGRLAPRVGPTALWEAEVTPAPFAASRHHVGGTLQQRRGSRANPRYTPPGYDPPLEGVPTLETLTRVALNALDDDENGFFLLVEGGAVDWALHDNQLGRTVEEMIDFKRSVAAVTDWIGRNGGWERTLLVVTADHDHMLWGPGADRVPFDPLRDNGKGRLPAHRWLSDSHSNALVPLFARGAGAERLVPAARSEDPFYGPYVDQTDVYRVLREALER